MAGQVVGEVSHKPLCSPNMLHKILCPVQSDVTTVIVILLRPRQEHCEIKTKPIKDKSEHNKTCKTNHNININQTIKAQYNRTEKNYIFYNKQINTNLTKKTNNRVNFSTMLTAYKSQKQFRGEIDKGYSGVSL